MCFEQRCAKLPVFCRQLGYLESFMRNETKAQMSPESKAAVDEVNKRAMNAASSVRHYSRRDDLSEAEAAALAAVADEARDKPILDIGVGGGRTVRPLLAVSKNYLGIDYAQPMIDSARKRFPEARFEHADARALDSVQDASIFLAVFSCNGIGMVNHEDRLQILKEVRRVLMPGGIFLFSTHNQSCPDHDAGFKFPEIELSANPARMVIRGVRFARGTMARLVNRFRYDRYSYRSPDYSLINDECHDYSVLLYYITLEAQRRQLESMGFATGAVAFDLKGKIVRGTCQDSSLTLLARTPT